MKIQLIKTAAVTLLGSVLLALSAGAQAAEYGDTTRDQRMDSALQNYRDPHRNDQPGRFARAENSVKRGAHRSGNAVKSGANKVGHAVANAGRKTAGALRNTGDKIHDKVGD
jgi:hypothetical protein